MANDREFTVRLKRPRAALPAMQPAYQPTEPLPGPAGATGAKGKDGLTQVVHVGSVGATGPQGPPGGASFVYTQATPAATWIITHNLNSLVQVTLLDSLNNVIDSDIVETSLNVCTIIFALPQTGSALINA